MATQLAKRVLSHSPDHPPYPSALPTWRTKMKSNRRKFMAAVCCGLSMQVASVMAAPIGGSATIPFDNGGTLSGFFEINTGSGGIVSWELTSTAFATHV